MQILLQIPRCRTGHWVRRKGICNVQLIEMWPRHFKTVAKADDVESNYWENWMAKLFGIFRGIIVSAWNLARTNAINILTLSLHWQPTVEIAVRIVFEFVLITLTVKVVTSIKWGKYSSFSWKYSPVAETLLLVILDRFRKLLHNKKNK